MATARKDYYETLGVDKGSTPEQIKKAYRTLVKEWHPDAYKGSDKSVAEEKFKDIQEAYDVLSDSQKKAMYDKFGYVGDQGYSSSGRTSGGSGGPFDDMFGDFQDVFDVFFGGSAGRSRTSRQADRAVKGEDIHAAVTIDLKEVITGKKVFLEYDRRTSCDSCKGTGAEGGTSFRTCPTCNGSGVIKEEHRSFFGVFSNTRICGTCGGNGRIIDKKCSKCSGSGKESEKHRVQLNIPAGVENGATLRLPGHGNSGSFGGPSGDLYVRVRVNMPKEFKRSGNDLLCAAEIDYIEAVLGTSVNMNLPEGGTETLKIPSGTNPGTVFRMKNLGVPSMNRSKRGDIIVTIKVKISKPSLKEKKLLNQLAKLKNARVDE